MDENASRFLASLGAAGGQGNMWELGAQLGLERPDCEALCLDLMSQGLLEMVNLAGAVKLSRAGQEIAAAPAAPADDLATWLEDLSAAGEMGLGGALAQDLAADREALRHHLARSSPLPAVVGALLAALAKTLAASPQPSAAELAARAQKLAP